MYYYIEPNLLIKESEVEAIQVKTFFDRDDGFDICFKLIIYTKANRVFDFVIHRNVMDIVIEDLTTNSFEIERELTLNFILKIKKEVNNSKKEQYHLMNLNAMFELYVDKTINDIKNKDSEILKDNK
nr:hypothetical protein [Campylobacter sp.]